ncbi:MAG: Tryptophan-tRNA ligase [Parcubacteria group bacterium GW2011_GWA1_44_13]|uniref:Tryptophan--tRNA ligase n=1 Tax=Candidatus Nomurabacteria bacterium GW2011_GWB1_44_12 TaxID=1618748 RepID=A0A837ICP5_9BACT|nr:MAG: Tryptophan-tRNA ligase [Candidatus Nomurabacteria bacterium GW2011_GWD1_44_10]KKT37246.1 MAG: Tryptophan-tRNA ligase [Candidatus Nomurabacteria bacterium GW2011_GWB1_44_12]KKT38557.1 MAG: Tryptophan-tRNA ligase [Parcubacteria group bacterium GW2011_GWA1_44_13]KKT60957.1 MAG: tryptophanyl-tRNA synthetase, tryptophanyl-tRNA synthetase [Parcubacteria group bacterium GW2011_GWC1_44_26]HBB44445.1 tryptophan--tRNA ligase [Candidatus Yonathbacteria bacterium]
MHKTEIVLSGIRATGKLHFGNFLGAVQNFVKFQQPGNTCLYFIADLHTLTTLQSPEELRGNLIEIVKDYIAAGLDPEKSVIYAQSSVPEISELCLYLSMLQPLGDLERIPTFKDLIRKNPDNVNLGIVTYPVLMAADILGPKATFVPVGEDQVPNIELARSLATRFNNRFGDTFVIPNMMQHMIRVPGLDGSKMGKSEADNAIDINSPREVILERYLKKGITDPERKRASDPGDPYDRCQSVYSVHELVTPGEVETRTIANACRTAQIGCSECKHRLVDGIAKILEPFQAARAELSEKDDYIKEILHEGGKKARVMIRETTSDVRDKMGIVIY